MPKIAIIQPTTTVNNLGPQPTARGERVVSGFGEGMEQLARGLDTANNAYLYGEEQKRRQAKILEHQQEEEGKAYANTATSDAQIQWMKRLNEMQQTAQPGAPDFAGSFLKEYDEYSAKTVEQAPTPAAKKYVQQHLTAMRDNFFGSALSFEAKARVDKNNDDFMQSVTSRSQAIAADPSERNLQVQLNALKELNPAGTPQERSARDQLAEKTLRTTAWSALVQKDPAAAKAMIDRVFDLHTANANSVSDMRARNYDPSFGNRPDGTKKGSGFLGVLQRPDGGIMTEYSVGVEINGKEMDIPTLVPTLSRSEVNTLLNLKDGARVPDAIVKKAAEFAKQRIASGKPVFARDGEQGDIIPTSGARTDVGGTANFGKVMDFIFEKEGGYSASDGHTNAPVNFGINQKANPDIDVKSLTKDKAAEIYKQRYWNAIGGDNLPPGVALMAMDAAVNQGVAFAKDMLAQSGGDIGKMAELRRQRYEAIIASNPQQARYQKVWMGRLEDATMRAMEAGSARGGYASGSLVAVPSDRIPSESPLIRMTPVDELLHWQSQATTRLNQDMALAREQLKSRMDDFRTMAVAGASIPQQSVPTVTELQTAYGEEAGARMYREDVAPMLDLNSDLQKMAGMSLSDRDALLRSRQPAPGEGFADSQKRFSVMVQADQMLRKQMEDDPAAYAAKNAPSVQQAWTSLQNAPATDMLKKSGAALDYVNATLAEQKRLGVLSPVILPKPIADSIVRQFYDQQNGGQNAALLMQQQAAVWGKYWPQVYGQVAKDLPGAALVIGSGMKPAAAELLARASVMKPDELKEGLPPDSVKDTATELQSEMAPFMQSLSPMAGGAQTFNTFHDQTQKLALMYVRAGESPSKAAQRAFDDTVGSKYEFVTDRNNKAAVYRVPKQYQTSKVEYGAERFLRGIDGVDLDVPPSLAGLDPTQARKAYVSSLKSSAYWVTAPDESGLVLYANGAAVMDAAGKPLRQRWDQLAVDNPSQMREGVIRRAR